ncbi:MAG: AAA family ATPase [Flavobacterium sp.]|uniref:AAA family ATPase n=1 Tax=Flavobacterium sp. TaxID=239 RepID=UPI002607B004|nr:AAA family ATPase [Flavobacterium sp.]MDD5150853.1 AAA family ATPase [Flavobacterium sp.]
MKAILTVGISGSGKTTWAEKQQGFTIISRDDIRREIIEKDLNHKLEPNSNLFHYWDFKKECEVNKIQSKLFKQLADEKRNIIVADTNISIKTRNSLTKTLQNLGYTVELKIFDISLADAIERDSKRPNKVGASVITQQFNNIRNQGL